MPQPVIIYDFHTHVGDIRPTDTGLSLTEPSPPPHYLMISSQAMEDPNRLWYRKRPCVWSFGFLKHAALTLLRRKRTFRGMTIPNLLNDMQQCHITTSVVLPIEYQDNIERSRRLISACRDVPNLIPFCSVHPRDPQRIRKLHAYMNLGAKGLKLHPNFQQTRPDSPENLEIYEAYAGYRRPLIFHAGLTGYEGYFRRKRTFSSVQYITPLPRKFPDMPIVLAHAGISEYDAAIALCRTSPNVYLELSGQPAQHIRRALSVVGSDRLLFGSDWPFWRQSCALNAVYNAVKPHEAALRRILYENAATLLRLHENA